MHGVSGKKIRLDSKLINSNIARSNRLQLIIEAVRKYVLSINLEELRSYFDTESYEFLVSLQHKSTTNITYPLNAQEKQDMLIKMGEHIRTLLHLAQVRESNHYVLLQRIFEEQYEQISEENQDNPEGHDGSEDPTDTAPSAIPAQAIMPKSPKDISSSSLQSVHDPEAGYRTKGHGMSKEMVTGYHANITESCDPEEQIHLITEVNVVCANQGEDLFLLEAVKTSQEIIEQAKPGNHIEEVITDGGYDSIENRQKMIDAPDLIWSVSKTKGGHRVYEMKKDEKGELKVYDAENKEELKVRFSKKVEKYVIESLTGHKRYMTADQIDNYIQRQEIEKQSNEESHNLRANVESTIHQTFHRLKKNHKIMYRGLIKCQWYVLWFGPL